MQENWRVTSSVDMSMNFISVTGDLVERRAGVMQTDYRQRQRNYDILSSLTLPEFNFVFNLANGIQSVETKRRPVLFFAVP